MKKIDGRSLDILEKNIEEIKQLFPQVFIEDKINFEKLQEVLGEHIEGEDERYDFTWNGKKDAIRISQTPTTGTLRPDKANSKNWEDTENLYIEGDNLEVLKILQKSYHNKIKMIYIDPPYNTGKDFVYRDNYRDNMKNYLEYTGQVDSKGKKVSTNTETSGRYHTDWLNMMYPRLRLARNLLTDDGVIFISIDDNEVHNLRKICDEIFGEDNFCGEIIWAKGNAQNDAENLQKNHETILVYSKRKSKIGDVIIKEIKVEKDDHGYYYKGYGLTTGGEGGTLNARPNLGNTVYYNPKTKDIKIKCDYNVELARVSNNASEIYFTLTDLIHQGYIAIRPPEKLNQLGCWTWDKKRMIKDKHELLIQKTSNGYSLSRKIYVEKNEVKNIDGELKYISKNIRPVKSIFQQSSGSGTKTINSLFNKKVFNNTKPIELLNELIKYMLDDNFIILDFFAGSSSTAHSVMNLNAKDDGHRKFIMVQLPEETDKKSEAFKAGYKTLSDIGRERIRLAGEKIKEDNKDKKAIEDLDIGFKSFKLDSSNIREWNPEYEDKEFDFESLINNFVEDRSEEDILYEIILKYGLDLTTPIREYDIDGKTIYDIGFGTLYICLDNYIDKKVVEKIVDLNQESNMERARVIFKDIGFKDDQTKLNAKLILENNGIEEVLSI